MVKLIEVEEVTNGKRGSAAPEHQSPDVLVLDIDAGRDELLDELTGARASDLAPPTVLGTSPASTRRCVVRRSSPGFRAVRGGRSWTALPDLLS